MRNHTFSLLYLTQGEYRTAGVLEYLGHTGIVCPHTRREYGLENSNDECFGGQRVGTHTVNCIKTMKTVIWQAILI